MVQNIRKLDEQNDLDFSLKLASLPPAPGEVGWGSFLSTDAQEGKGVGGSSHLGPGKDRLPTDPAILNS